jgi:hypothetical protein
MFRPGVAWSYIRPSCSRPALPAFIVAANHEVRYNWYKRRQHCRDRGSDSLT